MDDETGFRQFVSSRSPALVRAGWMLTGDEATAQDLVQTALVKTWSRWDRLVRQDAPEAYVRKVMVSTYLSWRRRRWHGEHPTGDLPEQAIGRDEHADADLRLSMRTALAGLPPRQRATLVLRFVEDLTETQTADALGCSVGTVKSQTSKALASLRHSDHLSNAFGEETHRAR